MEDTDNIELPSNYVTILDLRDRWLKQKQQQQQSQGIQQQSLSKTNKNEENARKVDEKPAIWGKNKPSFRDQKKKEVKEYVAVKVNSEEPEASGIDGPDQLREVEECNRTVKDEKRKLKKKLWKEKWKIRKIAEKEARKSRNLVAEKRNGDVEERESEEKDRTVEIEVKMKDLAVAVAEKRVDEVEERESGESDRTAEVWRKKTKEATNWVPKRRITVAEKRNGEVEDRENGGDVTAEVRSTAGIEGGGRSSRVNYGGYERAERRVYGKVRRDTHNGLVWVKKE